jgi:hypothetical protein
MELAALDEIRFEIDADSLGNELRVDLGGPDVLASFEKLVAEAVAVARPKTVYKLVSFDKAGDDAVIVDGRMLTSRVLTRHLGDVYRIFPFVATCGVELAEWARSKNDMMERFWTDAILDHALTCAEKCLEGHLQRLYGLEKTGVMTPGSLQDWPIEEQRPLFDILGDVEATIGVHLKESLMMDPVQSVSGIIFPTDEDFEECSFCPREECPKRRAAYEESLYETRYGGER